MLDLPLNGRNFTQLGLLQPGVVPLTPGLAEAGGSLREGQAYAVNGQRPESNNFLIDGANNFNGVDGGFVLKPPVDAITELRILTHNASAEFGQSLGSTTNIIARSGTNRFHGALWEFLRNDVFDATNYFAAKTEPLKQNQFGGTFGGPIRKDKTFSSHITKVSGTARGKRLRQPCHPSLIGMVISRPFARRGLRQAFATTRITSCSPYSSPSPIPTISIPWLHKRIRLRRISCSTSRFRTRDPMCLPRPRWCDRTQPGGVKIDHYLTPSDILNFRYSIIDGTQFNPIPTSGASVPGIPLARTRGHKTSCAGDAHFFSQYDRSLSLLLLKE